MFQVKIFVFLLLLGTIAFSNPVRATPTNSDSVTTSSINFDGTVTKVIDGDTLDVLTREGDTITIRLALIDAPETDELGYDEAREFLTQQCLDKNALVDPDDNQGLTYGRTVAVVYCEGVNVNEAILDEGFAELYKDFCDVSEFANTSWAQKHGCSNSDNNRENDNTESVEDSNDIGNSSFENNSDGDLDCKDFDEKNIPVEKNDPHNLDADGDGIGCEE